MLKISRISVWLKVSGLVSVVPVNSMRTRAWQFGLRLDCGWRCNRRWPVRIRHLNRLLSTGKIGKIGQKGRFVWLRGGTLYSSSNNRWP